VRVSTDELFAELDVAARFQSDCLISAPDEAVHVADVHTAAILWLQREGLDADARPLMGELRSGWESVTHSAMLRARASVYSLACGYSWTHSLPALALA